MSPVLDLIVKLIIVIIALAISFYFIKKTVTDIRTLSANLKAYKAQQAEDAEGEENDVG